MSTVRRCGMDSARDVWVGLSVVSDPSQTAVGAAALPTGTVTFFMSDIEGSTLLWEADPVSAQTMVTRHYELLGAAIALHGGARPEEQGEGDSVVGAFSRASDAVGAALDAQRAFAEEAWPNGCQLRVRIAVHTGEAWLRDECNYFGPAIIRCARLRAMSHGGQTVVSDPTRDLVLDLLPAEVRLRDLGSHRLKDLGRPERVWQLCHPELDDTFPDLRGVDSTAHNLPEQLTAFIGRNAEVAELTGVLQTQRLVTLTGAGGCGKTRLAMQVAADLVDRHPDGTWLIELAALSDPELVPAVVASTLGLRKEKGRSLVETLCDQLKDRQALLLLDNCEHVRDAATTLVQRLLQSAPGLRIMTTSRELLGIAGELTWRVPSLDAAEATLLFLERASLVRPGFAPDSTETDVITGICARLDGIPLAIELAAARIRMMSPTRIAAALDDRFRLLTGGSRTALPRQQTLETSVMWSHDLLDEPERAVLRRLSVFCGSFTLEGAESVCADEPLDSYQILELLSRLVDKSLVQFEHFAHGERYRLLDTIRMYGLTQLVASAEGDATRHRHLDFYLNLAERVEPELTLAECSLRLALLERDYDNLRAGLEWAETSGRHEDLLRLVTALTLFWELGGHLGAGRDWFHRALRHDAGTAQVRARALWGAAHVAVYCDDYDLASRRAPEALALATSINDEWTMARAYNTLGFLQVFIDPAAARASLQQSMDLGRQIGDPWVIADGLKMTTSSWLLQDDYDGLADPLAELVELAERLGNVFFAAWSQFCIGMVATRRGRIGPAREALQASLDQCQQVGDPATGGMAASFLAEIDAFVGDYEAADERLRTMLQRATATGGELAVPFAVRIQATVALGRGDPTAARVILEDSRRSRCISFGMPFFSAWACAIDGAALLASGDLPSSEHALGTAQETALLVGSPWLTSMVDHHLGQLARRQKHISRAEDLHHAALALRMGRGLGPGVVESLEALAVLAIENESHLEATRLFGAMACQRQAMGFARWPAAQGDYDEALAHARDHLADGAFEQAWTEGEQLTQEQAVAYASRARGERKRPSLGWASLTPTELDVVRLVATGLTNPEIGGRMFIAPGTVKTHLGHVFAKLGVSSRTELAAEVIRRGA